MKTSLEDDLSVMWRGRTGENLESTLAAFERICLSASKADVPRLIDFLEDDNVGFWLRELLMQPVLSCGGALFIEPTMAVLCKNELEGYDSDSLSAYLMDYVELNTNKCRPILHNILSDVSSPYHDEAEWLLEYCTQE